MPPTQLRISKDRHRARRQDVAVRRLLGLVVVLGVVAACSAGPSASEGSTATTESAPSSVSSSPLTTASPSTTASASRSPLLAEHLRPDGFGSLRIGMTVSEAETAVDENIIEVQSFGRCADFRPISTTEIGFTVVDGEIVLVQTDAMTTTEGVGVGATEAEIRSAYAEDRIEADTNRFAIYQVLVRPATDEGHALLFLFKPGGTTIERMRSGSYPEIVEYDEGCA
jgi:hypothetical protein